MSEIGASYAQALYSLADEETVTGDILQQLEALDASFAQEPDFLRLLSTPNLSKAERCQLLDDSFRGKVHPYVLNFLKLLTQKGYARQFDDCVRQYRGIYNEKHGIVSVVATTAIAMTQAQKEKLQAKLETVTGKTVQLQTRVEPACVGGVRLDYDGKRIDGTVKNRLDAMKERLKLWN